MSDYKVENGRIVSPGKFEGEAEYVPYLWNCGLDGMADGTTSNGDWLFNVTKEDKVRFPSLKRRKVVRLRETDQGFVCEV